MISVGSRDDRKGLSLRYGVEGGDMDSETEIEEGEACFQNSIDDGSTIDPDVALSYLDEKLQDVLGHFQKDFEGGVSAENLGAKFGGYGSFLPTYQRSPICPHPKTPQKLLTNDASISLNDLHIEGGRQNYASVNAYPPPRHGPTSTSGAPVPAPRGPSMNGKLKQEVHTSSGRTGEKITSNGQQPINRKFANASDQKLLKVRIKVGSDNLLTRKNAEIYSGLGLDVSPSSSLEASPLYSDDFCHLPHDSLCDESPTSILEMMTSFPILGGLLLSPLPVDLLCLMEKVKCEDSSSGSVHKISHESSFTVNNSDSKVDQDISCEKKPKTEDSFVSVEPSSNVHNGISNVMRKEAEMDNLSCEELVSIALRLPLLSDKQGDVLDFRKGAVSKDGFSVIPKEESLDLVSNHGDIQVEKPGRKDGMVANENSNEKHPRFPIKSNSEVSKGGKVLETRLVKPQKQNAAQKAMSHEKDSMKLSTSSSRGKKKLHGSQNLDNGVEALPVGLKNESSSKSRKDTTESKMGDPKNNQGKVRETYKDFFGEDPQLENVDDVALEVKPLGDRPKDQRLDDKSILESKGTPKERQNGKKGLKPGPLIEPTVGNAPASDTASATVTAVVNEDWVCCDKCEKWRLLPPGLNPGSLPEKWICSMLDWLPGMNRCSISQEETTKAITTHFLCPAPAIQGVQPGQPGWTQTGVTSIDPLHPDQRHQPFGPPSGVKKKHVTKDLPNDLKQERPSLSSNSTKKNLQASIKTRSLNDASKSPLVNEVEFQDSGQSSTLIPETQRLKHKDKKRSREKFVDEGNNALHLKIKNKRESSQDYTQDSKKVKMEDNHAMEKGRTYDHDGALFKAVNSSATDLPSRKDHSKYNEHPKDTKSSLKILGINPKNQIENGTYQMGNLEERNISKKRKSNEFEDSQIEEMSETGNMKGKKVKEPESREEETFASKGNGDASRRGKLAESSRKDVAVHALLAATSSSSKVSGSHKTRTNNQEPKGSPVESVSSSPLRILHPNKLTSSRQHIEGANTRQDAVSPKKDWEDDRSSYRSGTFKKELDVVESVQKGLGHLSTNSGEADIPPLEFQTHCDSVDEERRNSDQSHSNVSRSRKNWKGSTSRSKDKSRGSKSDIVKVNLKTSEEMNETSDLPHEEKLKGGQNKSQENPSVNSGKFENGSASKKDSTRKPSSESAKRNTQSIQDVKKHIPTERDSEQFSKQDVSRRGKSHSLPPSGKGQNETARPAQPVGCSQKENVGNALLVDAVEGSDASKATKQKKISENQNGNQSLNVRHPTPNRHKGRDYDAPSPLRRDSSSQAATAIKEAKALKHMADRLKNSGSNHESNSLYFQAALKFLYGSSILESNYAECGKHGDMVHSMGMYSSTAKLCEYVAHEYEKSKEMAAAALAYKLAEVACLKVVYSSHTNASKDRLELQTSLQIGPTGESPSSSASDIDNLNNPAAVDKTALAKGVNDLQIGGSHVIAARNKPNFMRILNFAQDVNFAMEASRRSQIAFAASGSQPEHAHHKEVIKPAIDFNFQDVEGLLQLVRVAMEVISR